jgi:hypothetical protein
MFNLTETLSTRRHFLKRSVQGVIGAGILLSLDGCDPADPETWLPSFHKLADLINSYRKSFGLPAVPLSPSLTMVAGIHVGDLETNHPDLNCSGNLHSWSKSSSWTGGCFDLGKQTTYPIMWNKPRELTKYRGDGYEIAYKQWGAPIAPEDALKGWQGSPPHNDQILNRGKWANYTYQALGAFYSTDYAVAWFGTDHDPTGR